MIQPPLSSILQAKITPPRLPQTLVEQKTRAILYQKAQNKALVLISAPAGYGKTTFANGYCQSVPGINCWYSLDSADNDTVVFGRYLVASFSQKLSLSKSLCARANQGLYQSLSDLVHELLIELQTAIEPLRLVFDDFHQLHHPSILSALNLFFSYRPPQLQIIIATRSGPEGLQRSFSQQSTLRLTSKDLQIGVEAVSDLFGSHGHVISTQTAQQLHQTTQGWITGLKLITLSHRDNIPLQATASSLQGAEIRNYLFHEIYANLSSELQSFLTKTAICERFNHELAQTLTNLQHIAPLLDAIDQQQFFLSHYGDDGLWFRYHPLLGEFLRGLICGTPQACELHLRAASWWLNQGQINIAAQHLAMSRSHIEIVQFLLDKGWLLFNSGYTQALAECLGALPATIIAANLHLTSMNAWLEYVVRRRPEKTLRLIRTAEQHLLQSQPSKEAHEKILALLGSVQAHVLVDTGEITQAQAIAESALRCWNHEPQSIKCAAIHSVLSDIAVENGDLRLALEHSLKAADLDRTHGLFLGVYWHLHQQSLLAYLNGNLNFAAQLIDNGMALAKHQKLGYIPRYDAWLRNKARLLTLRLQFHDAENHLQTALLHTEAWPNEQVLIQVDLCHIALAQQDLEKIEHLRQALESALFTTAQPTNTRAEICNALVRCWSLRRDTSSLIRFIETTPQPEQQTTSHQQMTSRSLALAHLQLGALEEAASILVSGIEQARTTHLLTDYHQNIVLLVAILWKKTLQQQALQHIAATLEWIGSQQAYLIALAHAEYIEEPLAAFVLNNNGMATSTAKRILQLIKQSKSNRGKHHELPDAVKSQGLTRQEWQLLQLITQGLSNDEICDQLNLAMNTVRSHIRRLNKKMGATSRKEAIQAGLCLQAANQNNL